MYLKQKASSGGPTFFEVQWNDNSTDKIEFFELPLDFNIIKN